MMLCLACGNTETFLQDEISVQRYRCVQTLDGDTEAVDDWGDKEELSDEQEDENNLRCGECGSDGVERDLSAQERLELQLAHTDARGQWHEDELPEHRQNKRLCAKAVAGKLAGGG